MTTGMARCAYGQHVGQNKISFNGLGVWRQTSGWPLKTNGARAMRESGAASPYGAIEYHSIIERHMKTGIFIEGMIIVKIATEETYRISSSHKSLAYL